MSIQELEYKHRDVIAVDGAGNLVTDSAGNLGNVIPPVIISPGASFGADDGIQGKSCWHGSIEYDGKTYDWSGCMDNGVDNPVRIETEGFLLRFVNRGAEGFAAVTNLRNLAKVHDSLTVKVYAGNNFDPVVKKVAETEEFITYSTEHDATRHGISVRWGEQSIDDHGYHCPGSNYYVGSVTINFSELTVTLNTDGVTWKSGTFKCGDIWDEPIDPDVDIITVVASIAWCNTEESTAVYTELSAVQEGNRVWSNERNRVPVPPGVDEETAKNAAAMSFVGTTESRDYIVGEDGVVYWEDTEYMPETAAEIQVRQLYDGITGKVLWTTDTGQVSINPPVYRTGRVWKKASLEKLTTIAEQKNFPASGTEIAEYVDSFDYTGLYIYYYPEGYYSGGYLFDISCSVEPFACGSSFTYKYFVLTGVRNDVSITLQSDLFDGLLMDDPDYIGGCNGLLDYVRRPGIGWLDLFTQPAFKCAENDLGELYPELIASKHGEIRYQDGGWELFQIDGGVYAEKYPIIYGYVYNFVRRWITSPCDSSEQNAVYTGGEFGKYYTSAENATNNINGFAISEKGNAVYSFKAGDTKYHRVGYPATDQLETDEEFE